MTHQNLLHPTNDVTQVPGRVLRGGLRESWTCPNPGWMQFCDAVEVDSNGLVIKIGGAPLDLKVRIDHLLVDRKITNYPLG